MVVVVWVGGKVCVCGLCMRWRMVEDVGEILSYLAITDVFLTSCCYGSIDVDLDL